MTTIVLIIHLIVSFFLIFIVLIQSGKGAELGAAFGGSSQTLFGARGAATLFSKLTTIAAVVFMLTSLTLAVFTSKSSSVLKDTTPVSSEQKSTIPQYPAGPIQGKGAGQTQTEGQAAPAVPESPSK